MKLRAALPCLLLLTVVARTDGQIAIDVPVRTRPVDFDAEIVPILRSNCTACHNAKKESGGLNFESPALMLKGGEHGPAVVAGKGTDSLLLKLAAHQQKPLMPPPGNKVEAKALKPTELGLIKLWIDQGATASVSPNRDVRFQPLAEGYQPSFAAAITPDGQYAVASRGNRLFVYHLPTAKLAATLVDPSLDGNVAHRDIVRSLAFDPTGDLLASGAFREVKLWRRPRPRELAQWEHDAPVHAVAVSADGKTAATGDEAGRIRVWDVAAGKLVRAITGHQAAVTGLAFSADGAEIFSSSFDKSLSAWTVADGKPVGKTTVNQPLHGLILVNRGATLVTGDADGRVHLWDSAALRNSTNAKPIREIKAHKKSVTALASLPGADGEFLSGGTDGFVRRWNAQNGAQIREFDNGAAVVALAVRPDGRRIATAGTDFVKLWADDSTKPLAQLQGDPRLAAKVPRLDAEIALAKALINRTKTDLKSYEGLERAVKVTADNVKKAEAELAQAMKMRDEKKAAVAKVTAKSPGDDKIVLAAQKAAADAETAVVVALTTVERMKATAQRTAETLAAVQKDLAAREEGLKKQEAAKVAALAEAKASRQPVRAVAFSADGQRLAVGCDDGILHLYHADSGLASDSLVKHRGAVRSLTFTPAGILISASSDRRALVWDAANHWRLERTIGGTQQPALLVDRVLALDFSRDGKQLATGGGAGARTGELKIWNVADGKLVASFADAHADTIFGVRFSPDGTRLATASADRFVKILDAKDGKPLHVLTGHTAHVLGVSWKADGKQLISCGADHVLKLWDAENGAYVRTMKGGIYGNGNYKREVASVAFIADSEEILAASGDGSVRLHRASSDNEIMSLTGFKGYQYTVAVSADGQTLLAAGSDGILRVWLGRDGRIRYSFTP